MKSLKNILIIFVILFVIIFTSAYFLTKNPSQSSPSSIPEEQATEEKQVTGKQPLKNLGSPTGTVAPKMKFVLSKSNFTATVGERFTYS